MNRSLLILVLVLGLATSCTKKKDEATTATPATSPAPAPGNDASGGAPTSLPKVEGIDVTGEKFEPSGPDFLVEELTIAEPGGKTLDQFPLLDWGPVKVRVENQTVRVFPNGPILQIIYTVGAGKKIERTAKCEFAVPEKEQKLAYKTLLESTKGPDVNWEKFYHVDMQEMASAGNKYAYNFFMAPDAEAKKYHKNNDGAASHDPIIRVLKYMKDNGCKW